MSPASSEADDTASVPAPPPTHGRPIRVQVDVVRAGTTVYRVHREHPGDAFNPTASTHPLMGGRFDTTTGEPAYTYLGADPEAAIAETICRDLVPGLAPRMVPFARVRGRRLSSVHTTRDLRLLHLSGAAVTLVGATTALTGCDAAYYPVTRAWVATLLDWFPDIDGFAYRPRHDIDRIAYVLYAGAAGGDGPARAHASLAVDTTIPLDEGAGLSLVSRVLEGHNAAVDR